MFSTIQLVSHVSYISKDGLVFSYHRDNRTNAFLSFNFNSCHFYNQNIDQYSGERHGYPVALSYQQCPATKGWFLDALNGQVGSAKIHNQTIFFTAPVGNIGVVSVGVDLKDFLMHVSEVGLDQSQFFITINGSSGSQILVSLNKTVDSLNDTDSSYRFGSDAEVVEDLRSTQNSSMQIKIPRVPMVWSEPCGAMINIYIYLMLQIAQNTLCLFPYICTIAEHNILSYHKLPQKDYIEIQETWEIQDR